MCVRFQFGSLTMSITNTVSIGSINVNEIFPRVNRSNKNNHRFGSGVWGEVKNQLGNNHTRRQHSQQYDAGEEEEEAQQEVVFLTVEQEYGSKDGTESSRDELQQIFTVELQETLKMEQELQKQLESK